MWHSVTLAAWARAQTTQSDAYKALDNLPESETLRGAAVPFPYADKTAYKSQHTNREINRAIENAPVERVPLNELHAIQHSVKADRVAQYIAHPDAVPAGTRDPKHGGLIDKPIVVVSGGVLYLHDGHHRATAAKLRGEQTIEARVADLDRKA